MLRPLSEVPEGELFKTDKEFYIKGKTNHGKYICFALFHEKTFSNHIEVDHSVGEKDFPKKVKASLCDRKYLQIARRR